MASSLTRGCGQLASTRKERRCWRPSPRLCLVKCEVRSSESGGCQACFPVKALLPGLLAAALLHSSAAHAGVVLKKADTKKLFQGQQSSQRKAESDGGSISLPKFNLPTFSAPSLPTPSVSLPSVPGAPSLPTPSLPTPKGPNLGLDIRFLALPASIAAIGAAAFAASRLDSGFGEFINEGLVKDSTAFTGYEEDPMQARGSPKGFLGLGNLYPDAGPGAKVVASKAKQIAGSQPTSPFKGKGSGIPSVLGGKPKKQAPKGGSGGGGGLRGLFK